MTEMLYLYNDPFVVDNSTMNRNIYLIEDDRYNDFCREDENLVRSLIKKFMIDQKIVFIIDDKMITNPGSNTASKEWLLHWRNFRSLVSEKEFDDFFTTLNGGDDSFMPKLIDLHMHIGMRVDHRLLNTITTRIMSSVQIIPHFVEETVRRLSWINIYTRAPFIWILILIQSIIKSETEY